MCDLLYHGTGLVDTAVKTAETGYMQRRLVKVCVQIGGRVWCTCTIPLSLPTSSLFLSPPAVLGRLVLKL